MSRKLAAAVLSAVVIAGGLFAAPASAAKISNGAACSKVNATTTVSGYKYRCAKNTLVKNSKLTWLTFECVSALKDYQVALKTRNGASDITSKLAILQAEYDKHSATLKEVNQAYDAYRLSINELRDKMNAAANAAEKLSLSKALITRNQNLLTLSKSKSDLSTAVSKMESDIGILSSAPATFKEAVNQTKSMASLLCRKGY